MRLSLYVAVSFWLVVGCGDSERCGGGSLEEYCEHHWCPGSPEEVISTVCASSNFRSYHVRANNECGGTTVHHIIALSQAQFHFDAKQKLIGVTQVSDTSDPPCPNTFKAYGMRCSDIDPVPHTACADAVDAGDDDAGT